MKPVIHPEITQFCTDLTGISQEQVDNGILLSEAINNLEIFLTKHVWIYIYIYIEHKNKQVHIRNMWRLGFEHMSKERINV